MKHAWLRTGTRSNIVSHNKGIHLTGLRPAGDAAVSRVFPGSRLGNWRSWARLPCDSTTARSTRHGKTRELTARSVVWVEGQRVPLTTRAYRQVDTSHVPGSWAPPLIHQLRTAATIGDFLHETFRVLRCVPKGTESSFSFRAPWHGTLMPLCHSDQPDFTPAKVSFFFDPVLQLVPNRCSVPAFPGARSANPDATEGAKGPATQQGVSRWPNRPAADDASTPSPF